MIRTISVLAALFTIVAAVAAQPGYLSTGCPAPLRFSDPVVRRQGALPPLPKDEPVPDFPIPTGAEAPCATGTIITSEPVRVPAAEAAPDNGQGAVSQQMLLEYFHNGSGGTNHNATTVVPFGFMPPASAPAPSSTAAYISR